MNTGIKQSLNWLYLCLLTFSDMFLLGDALQKYFWNVVGLRLLVFSSALITNVALISYQMLRN